MEHVKHKTKEYFFNKQLTEKKKKGSKKTLNACKLYIYTKRYIGFQSMKDKNPSQFIAKKVTFFVSCKFC